MSQAVAQHFDSLQPGQALPERTFVCDNVQLMMYNAALWNGHRIHFDEPYTKEVEGYPGLVIAGPLLGDWLHQCLTEWLGEAGHIASIEYSNRMASYVGETLLSGGEIVSLDPEARRATVEVFVKNEAGGVITPGNAVVQFDD